MKIAIYFDVSDLYHRVNKTFGNRKLSYKRVIEFVRDEFHVESVTAHAYGIQRTNEASGFISCLKRLGIETHFKKPYVINCGDHEYKLSNWSLGIALDAIQSDANLVVIGTGNPEFMLLGNYFQVAGRNYIFLTTDSSLTNHPHIRITENFLE